MITLLQHPPSIPSAEYERSKTTVPVDAMGAQIQIYVNTPSAPFSNMPDILCNVWTIMDPPHLPNHVHTTQSISPPVTSNPFTGSEYPLSFLQRKLNKVYIFSWVKFISSFYPQCCSCLLTITLSWSTYGHLCTTPSLNGAVMFWIFSNGNAFRFHLIA